MQAQNSPQERQYLTTVKNPEFRKLIEYDNRQLQEEIIPQYRGDAGPCDKEYVACGTIYSGALHRSG
jgi:hypothetical protein